MSHRHIPEQHYYEQVTRKIAKRTHAKQRTENEKAVQSSAPMPAPTSSSLDKRDSQCITLPVPESDPLERKISHALPAPTYGETAQAEAAPETPRSYCQYCGINTHRVKAHERHCSMRTHEKTG